MASYGEHITVLWKKKLKWKLDVRFWYQVCCNCFHSPERDFKYEHKGNTCALSNFGTLKRRLELKVELVSSHAVTMWPDTNIAMCSAKIRGKALMPLSNLPEGVWNPIFINDSRRKREGKIPEGKMAFCPQGRKSKAIKYSRTLGNWTRSMYPTEGPKSTIKSILNETM